MQFELDSIYQVLLSHFKVRQPIRHRTSVTAIDDRGGGGGGGGALAIASNKRATSAVAAATTLTAGAASNFDRIRQGLASVSARARQETVGDHSTKSENPSYFGLLAPYQKGALRENGRARRLSSSRVPIEKGWRDFQEDNSEGMLYQTRVGLSRNW